RTLAQGAARRARHRIRRIRRRSSSHATAPSPAAAAPEGPAASPPTRQPQPPPLPSEAKHFDGAAMGYDVHANPSGQPSFELQPRVHTGVPPGPPAQPLVAQSSAVSQAAPIGRAQTPSPQASPSGQSPSFAHSATTVTFSVAVPSFPAGSWARTSSA